MVANPDYGQMICSLLQPEALNINFTALVDVRTEVPLAVDSARHGRADLLIETKDEILLVEVKTAQFCDLTDNQNFGLDEVGDPKLTGYIAYLKHHQNVGKKVGLCLLSPERWRYRAKVAGEFTMLGNLGIPAKSTTWQVLAARIIPSDVDPLLLEFKRFLETEFMSITFSPDESDLLVNAPLQHSFVSASLKLHELVRQVIKELKILLSEMGGQSFDIRDVWRDSAEDGATIYLRGKKVMWFGMWSVCDWPLVVGVEKEWAPYAKDLNFNGLAPIQNSIPSWRLYQLPDSCFTGTEPMQSVISELRRILSIEK